MNKLLKIGVIFSIPLFLFLGAWFVLHGDIYFTSDIGRDFLLMNEITQKKFVLIGPRTDWTGLYHGPLWLYLNYPAFFLGKGNPLFVGWFWVIMTCVFSFFYYFLIKKVFSKEVALLFIPLFLAALFFYIPGFYNPIGALFMMPFFFLFTVMYHRTRELKYMLASLFFAGLLVQFQVAVGIPMLILSTGFYIFEIHRSKNYNHLFGFLILLIPLSTFILFDLKHNFVQIKGIIDHFSGRVLYQNADLITKLSDRIMVATRNGLGFFTLQLNELNTLVGYYLALTVFTALISKKSKHRDIYLLFIYFYLGFYLLSFVHSGFVLIHYYLPLIPLPILIFASTFDVQNKKVFTAVYLVIIAANIYFGAIFIQNSPTRIATNKASWQFNLKIAKTPFQQAQSNDFGLYYYAPDFYGYQLKYALLYAQSLYPNKIMDYSQKKNETFLLFEPPPPDRLELTGDFWKKVQVKLDAKPVSEVTFTYGFRVEKYLLTPEQLKIPSESILNDWVSQR